MNEKGNQGIRMHTRGEYGAWDLETGRCPNGHMLSVCHQLKYGGKNADGETVYHNRCKIQRAEQLGSKKPPHFVPNERTTVVKLMNLGALMTWSGPKTKNSYLHAWVQYVCGHDAWYEREKIPLGSLDKPLLCSECNEFRLVHMMSAKYPGWPQLYVFPADFVMKPAYPHSKNTGGSGRA